MVSGIRERLVIDFYINPLAYIFARMVVVPLLEMVEILYAVLGTFVTFISLDPLLSPMITILQQRHEHLEDARQ